MPEICKIIVVDGHDGVRSVVGEALEGAGYEVQLVASGEEMRKALARERADVVVVDVALLPEDGFELAQEAARSGASIILTTGESKQFKDVEASGHRYMLKPFMLAELLQLLDQVSRELRCIRRKPARRRR